MRYTVNSVYPCICPCVCLYACLSVSLCVCSCTLMLSTLNSSCPLIFSLEPSHSARLSVICRFSQSSPTSRRRLLRLVGRMSTTLTCVRHTALLPYSLSCSASCQEMRMLNGQLGTYCLGPAGWYSCLELSLDGWLVGYGSTAFWIHKQWLSNVWNITVY